MKAARQAAGLFGNRSGAAAVEFAITLPVLLMVLFGIVEIGRALFMQNALDYSVEQAARCASIDKNHCGSASAVESRAASLAGVQFKASVFTATSAACGNLVTASYPLSLYIPFVGRPLTLAARSCYPT